MSISSLYLPSPCLFLLSIFPPTCLSFLFSLSTYSMSISSLYLPPPCLYAISIYLFHVYFFFLSFPHPCLSYLFPLFNSLHVYLSSLSVQPPYLSSFLSIYTPPCLYLLFHISHPLYTHLLPFVYLRSSRHNSQLLAHILHLYHSINLSKVHSILNFQFFRLF